VPFRQIVKLRMALLQMFGWRAGSGWVVAQADTYRLTRCFLSVYEIVVEQGDFRARVFPRSLPDDGLRWE